MNKKILYTNKYMQPVTQGYQQPNRMVQPNMVQFQYQEPVNQTLEYIPNFPRTGGVEFGPGNFNATDYQNAITRDSTALNNYIVENPYSSYFMGSNQDHASSAGSWSGDIQLNREWLHKLKGFDDKDTEEVAEKLNKYQAPMSPGQRNNYIRRDQNKYSLYKMPSTRYYQQTDYSNATVSGGDTALNLTDTSAQSPAGGGGGMNTNQLAGYANMVNFAANSFSDPTKGLNTNPNANLQTTVSGPSDAPISTLADDAPITFSQNYAGNSTGINQLDAQDYENVINGTVPADGGTGGMLAGGAQGAMAGASLGPVGAIVGFAVGAGGSMYQDSKNEDARQEIRENLTAQNQSVLGSSTVAMKKANDNELARFLV